MLSALTREPATPDVPERTATGWRARRRLARQDRTSARLAELVSITTVLHTAAARVGESWCQGSWHTTPGANGSVGVCLVSAIRASSTSQLEPSAQIADRAIDTAWHALMQDPAGLRWVPSPEERWMRVRELAQWNDVRGRTVKQVAVLLDRSATYATDEMSRLRHDPQP